MLGAFYIGPLSLIQMMMIFGIRVSTECSPVEDNLLLMAYQAQLYLLFVKVKKERVH